MDMNIIDLQNIYQSGFTYPASEKEKCFAVVIADHMNSFLKVFISKQNLYDAILKNNNTGNEVILLGAQHLSLINMSETIKNLKPDHQKFKQKNTIFKNKQRS